MITKMLAAAFLGTTLLASAAMAQPSTTPASAKSATTNDQGNGAPPS